MDRYETHGSVPTEAEYERMPAHISYYFALCSDRDCRTRHAVEHDARIAQKGLNDGKVTGEWAVLLRKQMLVWELECA